MSKIILGLSGGIDSAVAAFLLKKEKHQVKAVYLDLQSFHNRKFDQFRTRNAQQIADYLSIPLEIHNLQESFSSTVVEYYIQQYSRGRTPNPCAICNQKIKFNYLLNQLAEHSYDLAATGHYARKVFKNQDFYLSPGVDRIKSQEYFLALLSSSQIAKCIFPLAKYTKSEVRKIAVDEKIPVSPHNESQDLCFGENYNNHNIISSYSRSKNVPGKIFDTSGREIGEHSGISGFTVGQRKGLKISGKIPYYVKIINYKDNSLIIAPHDDLYANSVSVDLANWRGILEKKYLAKIRYRHIPCEGFIKKQDRRYIFSFRKPQWAPAPGQLLVVYDHDQTVIGAGFIDQIYY
ncbi:MAG: hypothetical protein APR63_10915 [Desulfuromonas sp. SDB]|nr:MAG: hypothetical protein APR63_10915 [Desulfuromonas sp. SDB]